MHKSIIYHHASIILFINSQCILVSTYYYIDYTIYAKNWIASCIAIHHHQYWPTLRPHETCSCDNTKFNHQCSLLNIWFRSDSSFSVFLMGRCSISYMDGRCCLRVYTLCCELCCTHCIIFPSNTIPWSHMCSIVLVKYRKRKTLADVLFHYTFVYSLYF